MVSSSVDKSARSWLLSFYFTTVTTVVMSCEPSYSYYLQGLQLRKTDYYFSLLGDCKVPFRTVKSTQYAENSRSVPAWSFHIIWLKYAMSSATGSYCQSLFRTKYIGNIYAPQSLTTRKEIIHFWFWTFC